MREIIHTIKCQKCDATITEIFTSEDGLLDIGADEREPTPWMMWVNSTESVYRFFCKKCGHPTPWDSNARQFRGFIKKDTVNDVITPKLNAMQRWLSRITIPETISRIIRECPNVAIADCASAFSANIARVNEIAESTLLTIGMTGTGLEIYRHMRELFDDERVNHNRFLGDDPESENMKDFAKAVSIVDSLRYRPTPELLEMSMKRGETLLDQWVSRHSALQPGLHAMLLAQLSLSWTAFEVLSTDLWVAAVNERPNPLAVQFAKTPQPKMQDKSITLPNLAKYAANDFNLSEVMGDLFVQEKKVDFTSLESTQFAYEKAIGCAVPLFDDADLQLLELVRNLTLHRAGIVDQIFLNRLVEKQLSSHSACVQAEKGKSFPVDAVVVTQLAQASAKAGADLLQFVANYLWPASTQPDVPR